MRGRNYDRVEKVESHPVSIPLFSALSVCVTVVPALSTQSAQFRPVEDIP